jgi:hypothetical protein
MLVLVLVLEIVLGIVLVLESRAYSKPSIGPPCFEAALGDPGWWS